MSIKTRLFVFVSVFFLVVGIAFNGLQSIGYHINMSSMTDSAHTFKMYNSWFDAMSGNNPVATCTIPVLANGNYPTNPSTKRFNQWINACKGNGPHWFKYQNM